MLCYTRHFFFYRVDSRNLAEAERDWVIFRGLLRLLLLRLLLPYVHTLPTYLLHTYVLSWYAMLYSATEVPCYIYLY